MAIKKYRVMSKIRGFSGKRFGVQFKNGVAIVTNPYFAHVARSQGYIVTELAEDTSVEDLEQLELDNSTADDFSVQPITAVPDDEDDDEDVGVVIVKG